MESITLPANLTQISDYAFYSCRSLKSIVIPDSVASIGQYAFHSCDDMTGVTLGSGVTAIGECAFEYCSALSQITMGDTVTSIGDNAFLGCTGLTIVAQSCANRAFSYAETNNIAHTALDNSHWGQAAYTWAEDNSTVTATRVCAQNANHKETETVSVTSEITKQPQRPPWAKPPIPLCLPTPPSPGRQRPWQTCPTRARS